MPTPASETPHVALIGLPLQAILGEHGGDSAAVVGRRRWLLAETGRSSANAAF